MELTRRNALTFGSAAFVGAFVGLPTFASMAEDEIEKLLAGATAGEGELTLDAPEIAENGNTVPVSVSAPGAIAVTIFADGNPEPTVVTFNFGPLNASRFAATRIRLAQTQNVIAIAQMEDGSFQRAAAEVKVTIGGCGG